MILRKLLHGMGLRYRLNRRIEGFRPDLVFTGPRVVVFVDGCYWHGCPAHSPVSFRGPNAGLWEEKLGKNRARDERANRVLSAAGWHVLRVRECDIRSDAANCAKEIFLTVRGYGPPPSLAPDGV